MSMITELVKILKDLYVDPELDMLCGVDGECRQAIKESAQVIEELSAKLQSANMERSSQYYNGGWIPCSERMPKEENKSYWICTNYGYQCECRWTNVNPFWTDLTTDWHWHHMDVPQYSKVLAWMPLPSSYQG